LDPFEVKVFICCDLIILTLTPFFLFQPVIILISIKLCVGSL
jgi:hypothetical protein